MKFELTILGCGSATPTFMHSPTSQVIQHGHDALMIDCGEGTQIKLRRASIGFQRIGHIFISHLHGDHYLGFQGLLSTMHLLGRDKPLHVYAHADLQEATKQQLRISKTTLRYEVNWHPLSYGEMTLIADLERMQVFSFPLVHRIPTCGFLVREKQKQRNIKPEAIERYNIPFVRIRQIKAGADLALEDGHVVPNHEITIDPPAPRSYAFCSDTAFSEKTAAYVQGVDLLYHESTFIEAQRERAVKTCHSTAAQAAQVAKAAGASKLLLGHFSARYRKLEPFLIEACPIFPQSELAIEGSTIPIGPVHK